MRALFALAFLASTPAFALESVEATFQVRPEDGKLLANVSSGENGPAAELISLFEKSGVSKTVDDRGNPTYTSNPYWAFSVSEPGMPKGYSFFTRIPLDEKTWSLTTLVASDESVNPAKHVQGTELFLDGETSHQLYDVMAKAGLPESKGGAVSSYQGQWLSCDKRSFDPAKPFWVCVIRNYKW